MPIINLFEDVLSTTLDHVAVARNYLVKVPASDLPCTLIETLTVTRACSVPKESLLPCCKSCCVLKSDEEFCQNAGPWIFASPGELFVRWEIKHHAELKVRS